MLAAGAEQAVRAPDEVLRTVADVVALEPEWRELVDRTPGLSYFATPDWILSWWQTLGRGITGAVGVWRDERGRPDAVVPLGIDRHHLHPKAPIRVGVWTNLGSGPGAADHCGWAVAPGLVPSVRHWLASLAARRPMLLANLDPDRGAPMAPPGAGLVESTDCPRLDIPADGDADRMADRIGASAKFRKQLRAYRRKVAAEGVTFRWIGPHEMTPDLLHAVVALHEQRARQAGWAATFTPDRIELHASLVARAGAGRGPAMVLGERAGRPVAALYGFRSGQVFAYYQTGWSAELASANLATVLVAEAIRLAGADGAAVFDFLRGAETYKYRFGAVDRTDQSLLTGTGVAGGLMRAKFRWRERRVRTRRG